MLAVEREAQTVALRIEGLTLQEIAKSLGYKTKGSAHLALKRALSRIGVPEVEEYRELVSARLEKILATWWPIMITTTTEVDGQEVTALVDDRRKATDLVLKALTDIRALHGLDLAKPLLGSPENPMHVTPAFTGDLTDDQVDALIALDSQLRGVVIDQEGNEV